MQGVVGEFMKPAFRGSGEAFAPSLLATAHVVFQIPDSRKH
jgi:hypothetical protein